MMQKIYENFRNYNDDINHKINNLVADISRLQKELKKVKAGREGWVERIVKPLADEISIKLGGLPYEIWGPLGLNCEVSIYFFVGDGRDIVDDETYGIDVIPYEDDLGNFHLKYWNGETTKEYLIGSIAQMNGMNKVRKELPDSIDNIISILHHTNHKGTNNEDIKM